MVKNTKKAVNCNNWHVLTRPATAMKSCKHIQRMHIYANNIGPRAPAEVRE